LEASWLVTARLIIQRPGEPAAPLEIDGVLTLGGGEADGVRVPDLAEAALAAWPSAEGIVVEARVPGVVVSGRPLAPGKRRLLRTGDRARVEGLTFWSVPPAVDGTNAGTNAGRNTGAEAGTRELAGAILAGAGALSGPHLVVLEGPRAGDRLALHDGAVLGRGRGAELHLADPLASRHHARFTIRGGRASLEDLASKNGIAVNGRHARRSQVALRSGDALALGESLLVYQDGCPAPPAASCELLLAPGPARGDPRQPGGNRRTAMATALASGMLIALAVLLALAAVS
jgi:hypothetical protein